MSPKSNFFLHLQCKFELKPFVIISLSSTAVKIKFVLVYVRYFHLHLSLPIPCISLSLSLQHLLCIGEKQVLQRTALLIFLFILSQILRVVLVILLLVSEISLLILFLGLPPWLESYVVSCVLLTSWNGSTSFFHIIQYQISSSLFLIPYIST